MNRKLLTVIVPCYNSEEYVDRCISSITSQSYKEMEVVLVDDGSSDATPIKCDAWAIKDNRVRVIHQANCGSSAARENGLRAAKGEYITFVDADDWLAGDMYRDMIDGMEREKADIAVSGVADAFIAPPSAI